MLDQSKLNLSVIFCDEVGRGPLAGPVVACAVHFIVTQNLLKEFKKLNIRDSKKTTQKERAFILKSLGMGWENEDIHKSDFLARALHHPITYSIVQIDNHLIDEINILSASLLAMKKAVIHCLNENTSELVLVDGNQPLRDFTLSQESVVKGDSKYYGIALASILAKSFRDEIMDYWDALYPHFQFKKNKGYPTAFHRQQINLFGITPIHRKSFRGVQ